MYYITGYFPQYPEKVEVNLFHGTSHKSLVRVASNCMESYNTQPSKIFKSMLGETNIDLNKSPVRCFEWPYMVSIFGLVTVPFLIPGEEAFLFDDRFYGTHLQIKLIGHHLHTANMVFHWYLLRAFQVAGR